MKRISVMLLLVGMCLSAAVPVPAVEKVDFEPVFGVLGAGYDIFGKYADEASIKEALFEWEKCTATKSVSVFGTKIKVPNEFTVTQKSEGEITSFSGKDATEYGNSVAWSLGINAPIGGSFSGGFEMSSSSKHTHSTSKLFSTIESMTTLMKVSLAPPKGGDAHPESFLAASYCMKRPAKIALLQMDPQALFETYGTHVIMSGKFGGKYTLSLETEADTQSDLEEFAVTIKVQAKNILNDIVQGDEKKGDEKKGDEKKGDEKKATRRKATRRKATRRKATRRKATRKKMTRRKMTKMPVAPDHTKHRAKSRKYSNDQPFPSLAAAAISARI